MKTPHYAIIVAAGSGNRMLANTPKQYLSLGGKSVVSYSINTFAKCIPLDNIRVIINASHSQYWQEVVQKTPEYASIRTIIGGYTRFESVKNGLESIPANSGVVAVHDAARPLVSEELVKQCFLQAEQKRAVIPGVPIVDSLRRLKNDSSEIVDRKELYAVQTPQCFSLNLLKEAYKQDFKPHFTDDASVVEAMGHEIHLIEGEANNFKITLPGDLKLAAALLNC